MSDSTTTQTTSTPITVSDSAPSFDALESIIDTPDIKLSADDSDSGSSKSADETTLAAPKTVDTDEKPITQKATESQQTPKEGEETPKTESQADAQDATKALKFKVGPRGKEVEIPADAKVTIPVDGKDVEVTLEDLKREFNGKTVWEKKFSELDNNWKAFDNDRKETEKQLNGILSKAYQKDVLGAILEMVDIAQMDPKPVFDHIRDELMGDIEKYVQMSPQERELHWARKEIEFLSRDKKSSIERKQTEQAKTELESRSAKLRETLDVSDEWMQAAQKELQGNAEAYKEFLGTDKSKHSEKTVELADAIRRQDLSMKALELVNPNYLTNTALVDAAMTYLKEVDRKQLKGVTPDVFAKEIAAYLGVPMQSATAKVPTQSTALAEKIEQARKVSDAESDEDPSSKKMSRSKRSKDSNEDDLPTSWDDL